MEIFFLQLFQRQCHKIYVWVGNCFLVMLYTVHSKISEYFEKTAIIPMCLHLYVICCFFLSIFNVLLCACACRMLNFWDIDYDVSSSWSSLTMTICSFTYFTYMYIKLFPLTQKVFCYFYCPYIWWNS